MANHKQRRPWGGLADRRSLAGLAGGLANDLQILWASKTYFSIQSSSLFLTATEAHSIQSVDKGQESVVQENSPTRLRRPSACWTTASAPWLWYYSWPKPPACPLRDLRKTERREQNDSALSVHRTADSWGWCHLGQEANRYLSAGTLSTACSPEAPLVIRSQPSIAWKLKSIHSHIGRNGSVSKRLLM